MTRIAIVAGGGPAPGINAVIGAVTLSALDKGWEVLGVYDGYAGLLEGGRIEPLKREQVRMIHFQGGIILNTSRTNLSRSPENLRQAAKTVREQNIDMLVTIGGDDTAFGASELARTVEGLQIVHCPKTIDNDLPLPGDTPTFGYNTARHIGTKQVHALIEDASATNRWYIAVAMGRTAGHLALGISNAAGAAACIVPEEFDGRKVKLSEVSDLLEATVIKEMASGKSFGVAMLAEGVAEALDPDDLAGFGDVPRDDFGHVRLGEIDFGRMLCQRLEANFKAYGIKKRFVDLKIGYELRCAAPIPFDMEYTRALGSNAVQFLAQGGSHAIMNLADGEPAPIPFSEVRDPVSGRTAVRRVNLKGGAYRTARRFMRRLERADLASDDTAARMGAKVGLSAADFRERYAYLVEGDPDHWDWQS
jgi:ATP-dependent phosphofructokinase / diphosphate-dependent phosphofructokinase